MPYGSLLHIPPTNLLLLAAKQEPYPKKSLSFKKKIEEFSWKNVQENGPAGRKRSDRKSNRTRQKTKRGDSKVESNDSLEIPDRAETSDVPGLPSGAGKGLSVPSKLVNLLDYDIQHLRLLIPSTLWVGLSLISSLIFPVPMSLNGFCGRKNQMFLSSIP